jgi:hypothetical protein
MGLKVTPVPVGLTELVSKEFGGRATLREELPVEYGDGQRPIWNGTVYLFELQDRVRNCHFRVFAFALNQAKQPPMWTYIAQAPDAASTALDAVKLALRRKRITEAEDEEAIDAMPKFEI